MQDDMPHHSEPEIDALLEAARLIAGRKAGMLNSAESAALDAWLSANPLHAMWMEQLSAPGRLQALGDSYANSEAAAGLAWEQLRPVLTAPVRRLAVKWIWAAASILLILAAGIYFATRPEVIPGGSIVKAQPVLPGKEGAVLTLTDGSTVVLDSLANGLVAVQSGSDVMLKNGELTYNTNNSAAALSWNRMTTPRGRQFRLVLPDGTKVWLNAASSIRFPTAFTGAERKVEITGEAYFEVAPGRQKPFIVDIGSETEVLVLGTHFNVNAYTDEPAIRTTLLQGSVRVRKAGLSAVLQPGQQALITENIVVNANAGIAGAVAWKNGLFNFEDASLEEFMRQLARWYDIEIEYRGKVPQRKFQGRLGRNLVLSEVLETLAYFNIKYSMEGKKLIIME